MSSRSPLPVSEMEIRAVLAKELAGAQFVLLYGSFGTPYFTDDSDLDIAVQFPARLELSSLLNICASLEAATGRKIDLVDLRGADPVLAMQALRAGRPLLINDARAYGQFGMRTLSDYMDLKIDRRDIEQGLMQWGTK